MRGCNAHGAAKYECSRVEWMTDDGNDGARQFYASLGHAEDSTKVFYRVQGAALRGGLLGKFDQSPHTIP
jgi:hypothetical protein